MTFFSFASVTPADPLHGRLVVGLWLMGAIAAGSLVAAIVLWRIGRPSRGQTAREPVPASPFGRLAGFFAVSLIVWVGVGWLVYDDQDGGSSGALGAALDHNAYAVFAVLLAAAFAVTGGLYLVARLRASRSTNGR